MYTRKLDPKTIKIVWVLAAQEHIHTIKNNDMNFNRSPNGIQAPGCGSHQILIISIRTCYTFSTKSLFRTLLLKIQQKRTFLCLTLDIDY